MSNNLHFSLFGLRNTKGTLKLRCVALRYDAVSPATSKWKDYKGLQYKGLQD